jgi:hypothetical protein
LPWRIASGSRQPIRRPMSAWESAPSVTRSRNCAVRSDEKPLQIESSSPGEFRTRANRSYPEGIRLLLCISTGARLWRPLAGPPNENRRKARQSERALRGGHVVWAGPVKTFRNAGDGQNATAGLQMKGNLRAKRRDPWHRANAPPQAAADPALNGQDANKQQQTCLGLVREPVLQPPVEAS